MDRPVASVARCDVQDLPGLTDVPCCGKDLILPHSGRKGWKTPVRPPELVRGLTAKNTRHDLETTPPGSRRSEQISPAYAVPGSDASVSLGPNLGNGDSCTTRSRKYRTGQLGFRQILKDRQ